LKQTLENQIEESCVLPVLYHRYDLAVKSLYTQQFNFKHLLGPPAPNLQFSDVVYIRFKDEFELFSEVQERANSMGFKVVMVNAGPTIDHHGKESFTVLIECVQGKSAKLFGTESYE
jgi:hypothetical protein